MTRSLYCVYYQAYVQSSYCWFLVGVLRSFEHMAFDRTLDKSQSLFEFFVPLGQQEHFLELMQYFIEQGIVTSFQLKTNRLLNPGEKIA